MTSYKESASSSLDLPKDSYIYNIVPLGTNRIACISSDDSICIFDTQKLQLIPDGLTKAAHKGITSIKCNSDSKAGDSRPMCLTTGRDGIVKAWDFRTKLGVVAEYTTPKSQPLSMVAGNSSLHAIVAGMESDKDGPGDVSIFGWDARKPSSHTLEYAESHTDTITELKFLPAPSGEPSAYLLSASTDGLVNVYNTSITDEDDAVFQVINHKSAVHHAGLLGSDIYAIGTDETVSFYSQQEPSEEATEPSPVHLGDLRELLSCDFIAKITDVGSRHYIACGKHGETSDEQYFDLVPLRAPNADSRLAWTPDVTSRIRLAGGHGTEVVRDVLLEEASNRIFTCGEDSLLRCWQGEVQVDVEMEETKSKKRRKNQDKPGKEKRTKKS